MLFKRLLKADSPTIHVRDSNESSNPTQTSRPLCCHISLLALETDPFCNVFRKSTEEMCHCRT